MLRARPFHLFHHNDGGLCEVATGIVQQARYSPAAVNQLLAAFRALLEEQAVDCGDCGAALRHDGGRLVIDVSYGGGRTWRLTRPLPSPD
jgi:hypothetical protein